MLDSDSYTAFVGFHRLCSGPLAETLTKLKVYVEQGGPESPLVFNDVSGQQVDFNLQGSLGEVLARVETPVSAQAAKRPGRPRLGVVAREVTLLPRHWEWLETQPNGISAALRRLVDEARKREPAAEQSRRTREALSRVLWAVAGNLPGFEEASRSLFAGADAELLSLTKTWPDGVRTYVAERLELAGSGQA